MDRSSGAGIAKPRSVQRRTERWAISAVAVAFALAFALPALGATPKVGCWAGPKTDCGGDVGPTNGVMFVQKHEITGFLDELKCLGTHTVQFTTGPYKENYEVSLSKNISFDKAQTFAYSGNATRTAKNGSHSVMVTLNGKFVKDNEASISLTVDYGTCGTRKITLHWVG